MLKNIKIHGTVTKYTNIKTKDSLKKENTAIKEIVSSPNINISQNNNKDNIYNFDKKFNEYIDNFITYIKKEKPNINLELFFTNLKTLTIEEKNKIKFIFFKDNVRGRYNSKKNKIYILKNDILYSIYHELLHCASRKNIKSIISVGFRKASGFIDIGRGLNEGYTNVLEERYFKNIGISKGYTLEAYISSLLEKIVGQEKMTELFFNADLHQLIEELKKYSPKSDITTFIKNLDEIYYDIKNKKDKKKFYFISKFLLTCYSKKLYELYDKDLITFDDFENQIENYLNLLFVSFKKNKKNYVLITPELAEQFAQEIVNEILEKENKTK